MALLLLAFGRICSVFAGSREPEIIDPAEAMKDPDFRIQGEYLGQGTDPVGEKLTVGAQVIARGNGQFEVVVMHGGLPGQGWKRGDLRTTLLGNRKGELVELANDKFTGKIAGATLTVVGKDNKANLTLTKTERHSPTEAAKPPQAAAVLFDGTSPDNFINGRLSKDGNLMSEVISKQQFGDFTLHLEFRLSYMPLSRGQARSNSGVYLHDCYEVQVLDSFGLEGEDNQCGGFYQIRKPEVNMCFPPLTWQTYDITFVAPRYKDGKKVENARAEVRHNGVVIHPDFALPVATPGREDEGPAPRRLFLQGHGNKVEYRNIWLLEKK